MFKQPGSSKYDCFYHHPGTIDFHCDINYHDRNLHHHHTHRHTKPPVPCFRTTKSKVNPHWMKKTWKRCPGSKGDVWNKDLMWRLRLEELELDQKNRMKAAEIRRCEIRRARVGKIKEAVWDKEERKRIAEELADLKRKKLLIARLRRAEEEAWILREQEERDMVIQFEIV